MRFARLCLPAFLIVTAASAAHAEAPGQPGFAISVQVPEVCDIRASDFVLAAGTGEASGQVREYCNSSRGFQIMASHRALEPGEAVQVNYGGQVSALNPEGYSPLAFRAGARIEDVPVQIRSANLLNTLAISLALTPL